jgi:hypothetical protein
MKIAEQPFMTNPGISSSPTDLEGFSLSLALPRAKHEQRERERKKNIHAKDKTRQLISFRQ